MLLIYIYHNKIEKPVIEAKTTNVTVTQIADNYLKAIGGADKVKAVKTLLQKGKIETMGMSGDYTAKAAAPNKTVTEFTIMGMTIKQVFDGQKGYANQAGQKMDLPTEITAPLVKTNSLFVPLSEGYKTAKVDGIFSENGVDYYKVVVSDISRTDYYDVKTGLLMKSEQKMKTPQGEFVVTTTNKMYKSFDGILIPTEVTTEMGPQTMKVTISSVEVNKNVSDADFK